jgi:Ca2+-binding RTX toxin-like protein
MVTPVRTTAEIEFTPPLSIGSPSVPFGSQGEFWVLSSASTASWVSGGTVHSTAVVLASVGFPNIPPNAYEYPAPVFVMDNGFVIRPHTGPDASFENGIYYNLSNPEVTVSAAYSSVAWAETSSQANGIVSVKAFVRPIGGGSGTTVSIGEWSGTHVAGDVLATDTLISGKSVIAYINPDVSGGVIEYRMLDASGAVLGLAPSVVPGTASSSSTTSITQPHVVPLVSGGFIVAYMSSHGNSGDGTHIRAQKFDGSGVPAGGEISLVAPINLSSFDIVELSNGSIAVAFDGYTGELGPNDDLFVQLFNAELEAVGDRISIDTSRPLTPGGDTPISGSLPSVAALSDGKFAVSWTTVFGGALSADVVGQVFRSDGVEIGDRFIVNGTRNSSQNNADLAGLDGDAFYAAWDGNINHPTAGDNPFGAARSVFDAGNIIAGTPDIMGRRDLDDNLTGTSASDVIRAFGGNDRLDGGGGTDLLYGGKGDDTYIVDNTADQITEEANEGTDSVESSAAYTLSANVENLKLTGSAAINGTGNTRNNILDGASNSAANVFTGGDGNDTYVLGAGDTVVEGADAGTDRVQTALATYSIDSQLNIEQLQGLGAGHFTGTGNSRDNLIMAGTGGSILDGAGGNDDLEGGSGADDLRGGADDDVLLGKGGADTLTGGAGVDWLDGGAGDDVYVDVDPDDGVFELADEGFDTIKTSASSLDLNTGNSIVGRDSNFYGWSYEHVEGIEYTGSGAFTGIGNARNNRIETKGGNDSLDGGAGVDTLIGGAGDDTYVVDSAVDVVQDSGGSNDVLETQYAVTSLANYIGIEHLSYTGGYFDFVTSTFYTPELRGNAVNNRITGGAGRDILYAGAGIDTLSGGEGSDTYILGLDADDVIEDTGIGFLQGNFDEIRTTRSSYSIANLASIEALTFTGIGNATLVGNSNANSLIGGAGNDLLDGGGSDFGDYLRGGAGNDTYVVRNDSDQIDEYDYVNDRTNAGGIDLVRVTASSFNLQEGSFLENLAYGGNYGGNPNGTFTGNGNSLANTLTGGAQKDYLYGAGGNDVLNGLGGADDMNGGAGNDTYFVNHSGDIASENVDDGLADVVMSSVTYRLGQGIDIAYLTGSARINLTGNEDANTLTGNAAANVIKGGTVAAARVADKLNGGLGHDTLSGGLGRDTFVFNSKLSSANIDKITDFSAIDDVMHLENTGIFTALGSARGTLSSVKFWASTTGKAHDTNDRILYNTRTGELFYDPDGTGRQAAVEFANLTNKVKITAADFVII